MYRVLIGAIGALFLSLPAVAQVQPFPAEFRVQEIPTNETVLHVRIGGHGPAVILLHGFADTGDMWAPLAADLARDHTVIVPDLRGMGLSSRPAGRYDKNTEGRDIAGLLDALHVQTADLVTHDIGNMVGYAFAAQYPDRVSKFALLDAPLPGIGPGTKSHAATRCGIFPFGARMKNGWSPGASGSISTASGTNSPPIRSALTKSRGSITRNSTPARAPCMPRSNSSRPSTRMRSTIRPSSRRGN